METPTSGGTSPLHYEWLVSSDDTDYSLLASVDTYSYIPLTGTWYYKLQVTDSADAAVAVNSTAIDVKAGPDFSFTQGTTGHSIQWAITGTPGDGTYVIYRNGTSIASGSWSEGTNVTYSVDGLAVGNWSYTLVATNINGSSSGETIETVLPSSGLDVLTTEIIVVIVCVVAGVIVVVVIRRKKPIANGDKKKKENDSSNIESGEQYF
jgi:hypothetical protein